MYSAVISPHRVVAHGVLLELVQTGRAHAGEIHLKTELEVELVRWLGEPERDALEDPADLCIDVLRGEGDPQRRRERKNPETDVHELAEPALLGTVLFHHLCHSITRTASHHDPVEDEP